MREIGMTGAPGLAKGTRGGANGRRQTASRLRNRGKRLLRVAVIYVAFASALISCAYLTARAVLDERQRHQIEVELRKADEKRQGRVVYAQKDGHCRMARFDNASGRMEGNVTLPCDTPSKDPVAAARDFNWGNR
jgi:hypothetical protein